MKTKAPIAVVVAVLAVGSAVLHAQNPNNPFDQILTKLNQIVGLLTAEPPAPVAAPVILDTGYVFTGLGTDVFHCVITNLGTQTIAGTVTVKAFPFDTTRSTTSFVLTPEQPSFVKNENVEAYHHHRCQFSFTGFANDVRANGQVLRGNLALNVLEAR